MNRTTLNFVVDTAAFVGFVLLTTTGVLMHYLLPPGSGHHRRFGGWTGTIGGRCISGFPLPSSGHSRCTARLLAVVTGAGLRPDQSREPFGNQDALGVCPVIIVQSQLTGAICQGSGNIQSRPPPTEPIGVPRENTSVHPPLNSNLSRFEPFSRASPRGQHRGDGGPSGIVPEWNHYRTVGHRPYRTIVCKF